MKSNWSIEEKPSGTFLRLLKEWDLDRVNEFSNFVNTQIEPGQSKNFIVDLSKVDYIDSMALGVLINLKNKYKAEGGNVYLLTPSPTVEKILKQSGLVKIFTVYYSEPELEKHLASLPGTDSDNT